MGFDGPKQLKSIEKHTLSLMFGYLKKKNGKTMTKEPHKSFFLIQNGDMGFPSLTYALILDFLVRCPKKMIFGFPPVSPTN